MQVYNKSPIYCCVCVAFLIRNIPFHSTTWSKRITPSPNSILFWISSPSVSDLLTNADGPGGRVLWSRPSPGVESQTTAAAEPVTSSVSSKSTEQQKALRQRDGHLPPARHRHLGSASWGWPAATSRSPLQSSSPSRYLCAQRILSNDLVRMVWSSISQQWADSFPVSASTEEFSISQCNRNPSSIPDIEYCIDTSLRHIDLDFQLLVIGAFFGVNFYFWKSKIRFFELNWLLGEGLLQFFLFQLGPTSFTIVCHTFLGFPFVFLLVDIRSKKVWRNRSLTC